MTHQMEVVRMSEMVKIAYNGCYGGFNLSEAAIKRGREISGDPLWGGPCLVGDDYGNGKFVEKWYGGGGRELPRNDPTLIKVIEQLGVGADGDCASLCLEEVPKGTLYRIDEYDGMEVVQTKDIYDWEIA